MLEKPLADVVSANQDLWKITDEYGKVIKDLLKNPKWEADLQKVKAKAIGLVVLARARISTLQVAISKAKSTPEGADEFKKLLIPISSSVEQLLLMIKKVEELYNDQAVVPA